MVNRSNTLSPARVTSQPAVGGEVPPQLLRLRLRQRLERRPTGAAVETEPLHRLLEGGDSQLPGHLATQTTNQRPHTHTPNCRVDSSKASSITTRLQPVMDVGLLSLV